MKLSFKKERFTFRNIFLLLAGMMLINLGIAFSIKANLGTSPVSSIPFVLSQFTNLTVGNWSIIVHCTAILLQILVLRKDYNPFNLLQIVLAFIFGYMTDFCIWLIRDLSCNGYIMELLFCLLGTVLIGLGVSLQVEANILMVAIEGLALAIATKYNKVFGNVKSLQDLAMVAIACIISFVALGKLVGVREGTIIAAVLVGQIAKIAKRILFKQS